MPRFSPCRGADAAHPFPLHQPLFFPCAPVAGEDLEAAKRRKAAPGATSLLLGEFAPVLPPRALLRLYNTRRSFGSLKPVVLTADISAQRPRLFSKGSVLKQRTRGSDSLPPQPVLVALCFAGTCGGGFVVLWVAAERPGAAAQGQALSSVSSVPRKLIPAVTWCRRRSRSRWPRTR